MGLFSKEECFNCGKKVGALSRLKLRSGEFLCEECRRQCHPFMHVAEMTRDEFEAHLQEMKESEAHYQEARFGFRQTVRATLGKSWKFLDNMETGEFVLETPETAVCPNHYVYKMSEVRPFDKADQFLAGLSRWDSPEQLRQKYYDLITVEERRGSDGKVDSWILRIPYFREHMDIRTKLPGSMEESDVRFLQATIQAVIGSFNSGLRMPPTQLEEIRKQGKSLGDDASVTSTAQALGNLFSSLAKK